MQQPCQQCTQTFEVTPEDLEFYKTFCPYPVPPPKCCPECRQQRRLAFRNERKLYKTKSSLSGKTIVSLYSPDKNYIVYDKDEWWSDSWDGTDYARNFDFSKTLAQQLKELYKEVPHMCLYTTNTENSYYNNYALNQKNCYLLFGAGNNEDCMYGKYVVYCKDAVDCLMLYSSELCYEGVASERCYSCKFFTNCRNCTHCTLIEDCESCQDCIACFGLHSKRYHVLNKELSKEKYEEFKANLNLAQLKEQFQELKSTLPHIASHIYASENCTGDSVYNCKNCHHAFDSKDCEDCKYIYCTPKSKCTQDCVYCAPDGVEFCYNVCSLVDMKSSMSVFYTWHGSDLFYCIECHQCNNCFGCIGLRHKNYCILNKQYTKEEYEELVSRIIAHMEKTGEWGEYFPYELSPFAYNETIAQEYFPLEKNEVLALGSKWLDEEPIKDRPFRVAPQELEFYKKMDLPTPTLHPDQRHLDRLALHNSQKLHSRKCAKCQKEIKSIYPSESPKIVYCKECYQKEAY
jgi:hypothetical protein